MPSNEQPKTLSDYTPLEWKSGKIIKSTNLNNIENLIDILTDLVLNIDNRLVDFVGANSTTDGVKGVVPAPRAGDENKYLKGDGSWETPAIKYNINDSSVIEGSGTFNMSGNITAQTFSGSGENLTNISGTEVSLATSSAAGAMSSADKVKLDELPTNTQLLTNYVSKSSVSDASGIPNADTTLYGLVKVGSNINVNNGVISVPIMGGATSDTAGSSGLVPTPASGKEKAFLQGDASWCRFNIRNGPGDFSIEQLGAISAEIGNGFKENSATGYSASAFGVATSALGDYSATFGQYTIAKYKNQFVFGQYNKEDNETSAYLPTQRGKYIEIVGNGTGGSYRSNARTLDWEGNETIAGQMTATLFNGSGAGLTIPTNLIITPIEINPNDSLWRTMSVVQGGNTSTSYQLPITISGITSSSLLFIIPNTIDLIEYNNSAIRYIELLENTLVIRCTTKPTRTITIGVIIYN